jgi:mRNA-degrading endonuclease RelE of RelBE toxin-antitoxin system
MSLTVVLRETALRNLARIRGEDKDRSHGHAVPSARWPISHIQRARSRGEPGVYRLHAGDVRILYEVDDQAATVYIINIGIIT